MILPSGVTLDLPDEDAVQTSRTYRLDASSHEMIDEIKAVEQAVILILNTNRGEYPIYSYNYGFDATMISVNDPVSFQAELIRRVKEALLQDDRIKSVEDFRFTFTDDTALVEFTVVSRFGSFDATKAVSRNV